MSGGDVGGYLSREKSISNQSVKQTRKRRVDACINVNKIKGRGKRGAARRRGGGNRGAEQSTWSICGRGRHAPASSNYTGLECYQTELIMENNHN